MAKRLTHQERYAVEGIRERLKLLVERSHDATDLEEILGNAVQSLYYSLPGGRENYKGKKAKIGNINLIGNMVGREYLDSRGIAYINFSPSEELKEKLKYASKIIARIYLRDKKYVTEGESKYGIFSPAPEKLMEDTEKIMKMLGLKPKNTNKN
ncbi:MAG: hypothetical protein ABIH63_03860 [archaeon]